MEASGLLYFFFGVLTTLAVGYNAQARAERWGRWLLEPGWLTKPKGILKRANLLCKMPSLSFLVTYFPLLLALGIAIPVAAVFEQWVSMLAFGFGFLFPRVLKYNFIKPAPVQISLWMLVVAAKKVAAFCDLETTKDFLYQLARNEDLEVRIASVNGFMEIDPMIALPALQKMEKDPEREVSKAAMDAHRQLSLIATGKMAQSPSRLKKLIEEHKSWATSLALKGYSTHMRRNMQLTATTIDDVVYSQLAQRLAFPDLYCSVCHSRAAQSEYLDWNWVYCKVCGEAKDLQLGVKTVTAQVGGEQVHALEDGILTIAVWDEERKTAKTIEADVLEIIGGRDINYDWAVSAVVQALHHRQELNAPPIKLVFKNPPVLDQNTKLLLKSFAQEA